jgi:hypothetical protein
MSNCSVDQRAPKRQSRSCKRLASLIAICKSERRKKSNYEALVSQPAYLGALRGLGSERCGEQFNGANGVSDIEGKTAREAASESGQRASFKA